MWTGGYALPRPSWRAEMAYRGPVNIVDADPGARLVEQIEGTMLDQCGKVWVAGTPYGGVEKFVRGLAGGINYRFEATTSGTSHATTEPTWSSAATLGQTITDGTVTWTNRGRATYELVEIVTLVSIDYRIWRNRGSNAANPNRWGQDYYFTLSKTTAPATPSNATIMGVAENYNTGTHQFDHACMGSGNVAVGADGGVSTVLNPNATGVWARAGFTGLLTTGFNAYIRATRDTVYVGVRVTTSSDMFGWGVFESFLTSTPVETFPLYLQQPRGLANVGNWRTAASHYAWSRHPGRASAASATYNMLGFASPIGFSVGGIDISTTFDHFHNDRWLVGRWGMYAEGGTPGQGNLPSTYGQIRGALYDAIVLANVGASMLIGDHFVDADGKAWVKFNNTNFSGLFLDRDAV